MQNNHINSKAQTPHELLPHRKLSLKIQMLMGGFLLLLAFIGVILTSWQNTYTHTYWLCLIFVFAFSSLGLSWLSSRQNKPLTISEVGREVLHWLGLIITVYLVECYKKMGLFSTPIASLVELQLLSLTAFLAGVHFNAMFLLVGIFLGIIALLSVIVLEYLSFIVLPILIIFVLILGWQLRHKPKDSLKN